MQLPQWSELDFEGKQGLDAIWDHDFCSNMEEFLDGYIDPPVKSVADIVKFNSEHAAQELPKGDESLPNLHLKAILTSIN